MESPIDLLTAIDNLLDTCENRGMYYHEDCKNVREALANLKHESGLISAIEDIYKMMDEGILVRNTSDDASPNYYTRSLQFVQRLAKGKQAVDNAKEILKARKLIRSARGLADGEERATGIEKSLIEPAGHFTGCNLVSVEELNSSEYPDTSRIEHCRENG